MSGNVTIDASGINHPSTAGFGDQKFEDISHSHPAHLPVFQVGRNEEAGYFYYVMELADPVSTSGHTWGEHCARSWTGAAIAVARHLPAFRYDPDVCRFKTWLLNQSSWRIKEQLRKRHRNELLQQGTSADANSLRADEGSTATIERAADPATMNLDALFETEWQSNLLEAALETIKTKFSLKQIQILDLHALKEWPARDVAKSLGVTLANVYVTKHRIATALRKEMRRMERTIGPGDKQ